MSTLNRKALQKLILKEFKMMGMAPMDGGMIGHSPYQAEVLPVEHEMAQPSHHGLSHKGSVSKEDCCKAVLCLIECCDCPETKRLIKECCDDILATC